MREIEWKLLSELMKNSRRSDRELARAIGTSQPTITRTRHKLEKEGYIKEYTMMPNFEKMGFELMAFTFTKFKREFTEEELEKIRHSARKIERQMPHTAILVMTGVGLGFDRVVVSFHENYASFLKFIKMTKRLPFLELLQVDNFLVSLIDEDHYMPCTFSGIANYLLKRKNMK